MTKKLVKPLPKTKISNWEVQPILMWMEFIFPLIWMLGVTFSMDEMTMCFKGHHTEIIRIMDKAKGGELQIYDIFQK